MLSKVFADIKQGNADHSSFTLDSQKNPELIREIFNFSLNLFKIPSADLSVHELLQFLDPASTDFNIQFMFYNERELICEVKKNKFIYSSVLNFYYKESSSECFMLYHINYNEIRNEILNVSEEFDLGILSNIERAEEDLMKELVGEMSKLRSIEGSYKNELNLILSELKKVDFYGYEAEDILKHLIS